MSDPQTVRELTELGIVAGAAMFVCLTFVWWQRSLWQREKSEMIADNDRDKRDMAEAHRIELRELDAFNAQERRRMEGRISDLEAQIKVLMQALWDARLPVPKTGPLTFNTSGDLNVGGPITGRDARP